jgi:hypothetical protein
VANSTATFTNRRCELDSRGTGCEQRRAGEQGAAGAGQPVHFKAGKGYYAE